MSVAVPAAGAGTPRAGSGGVPRLFPKSRAAAACSPIGYWRKARAGPERSCPGVGQNPGRLVISMRFVSFFPGPEKVRDYRILRPLPAGRIEPFEDNTIR